MAKDPEFSEAIEKTTAERLKVTDVISTALVPRSYMVHFQSPLSADTPQSSQRNLASFSTSYRSVPLI